MDTNIVKNVCRTWDEHKHCQKCAGHEMDEHTVKSVCRSCDGWTNTQPTVIINSIVMKWMNTNTVIHIESNMSAGEHKHCQMCLHVMRWMDALSKVQVMRWMDTNIVKSVCRSWDGWTQTLSDVCRSWDGWTKTQTSEPPSAPPLPGVGVGGLVYYCSIGMWQKFLCKSAFSVVKINTVPIVQHSGQANGINIWPVQSFADDF